MRLQRWFWFLCLLLLVPWLASAQCPGGQCLTIKGGPFRMEGIVSGGIVHTWPATITSYTLLWPSAQGAASTVLGNDGSGNLSWTTVAGAGGAPSDATYITRTANSTLTAEFSLGSLTTGLLLNTVSGSTGTLTAYTGVSACSAGSAITAISASGAGTCTAVSPSIGTAIGSGTAGSVLFLGALGVLAQDHTNFRWENDHTVAIGPTSAFTGSYDVAISGDGPSTTYAALGLVKAGAAPMIELLRSNGAIGAETSVSATQPLGELHFLGYESVSAAMLQAAQLRAYVDAAPASGVVPGRLAAYTSASDGSLYERLRLTSVGTTGVTSPNASSTVVIAGQTEVQGVLLSTDPGNTAGYSGSYAPYAAHVIASDAGNQRGIDLVSTGQGYLYWDTLRTGFSASAANNTMQNGDLLGVMGWSGFAATSGVFMAEAAKLQVLVDGSVDATNHYVPGRYEFYTSTTAGVSTLALTIDATQTTKLSGNLLAVLPSAQVLTAGATISADACGGYKRISSASAITTSTTNTITAPAAANAGCVMQICNVNAADAITLDKNANILLTGGADVALGAGCCIDVVSTGASGVWRQTTAQLCSS